MGYVFIYFFFIYFFAYTYIYIKPIGFCVFLFANNKKKVYMNTVSNICLFFFVIIGQLHKKEGKKRGRKWLTLLKQKLGFTCKKMFAVILKEI